MLYNRFIRRSRMGVFDRILAACHRGRPTCTKGGLNSKLHAACDGKGPPVVLLLTEGQASDHRGVALMLPQFPTGAKDLIVDRDYDSVAPCIPSTRSRKQPIPHGALL